MVNISKLSFFWQKIPKGTIKASDLGYIRPNGVVVFQSDEVAKSYIQNCYEQKVQNWQKILELVTPSNTEITEGVEKLTNKLKFINRVLGHSAKTTKPVSTSISDIPIKIMMDKTKKGKIKINISSYTEMLSKEDKLTQAQMLDLILDDKNGRMLSGHLNTKLCTLNFERNQKTGQRKGSGDNFFLIPNINENCNVEFCKDKMYWQSRSDNIVSLVFHKLFSDLSLVKPKTKLLE